MTLELTDEFRRAIAANGGAPLTIVDPATNANYVLIRADEFERVRAASVRGDDFIPEDAYPFVDEIMAADDADDPLLDDYQAIAGPRS